jgi:hypothetical protein
METQKDLTEALEEVKRTDPRKTDLELFYELLPSIAGAVTTKGLDISSNVAMSLGVVREILGQCAVLGVIRPTIMCNDKQPLAIAIPGAAAIGQPSPQQQGGHFGGGGLVEQYPTQQRGGGVQRQQANYGDGSRGVLVDMFPNPTPPQT